MVKFIAASLLSLTVLVLIAFLWPRFTSKSRPEPLSRIHSVIASSQVGPNISSVLGVSGDRAVEPINISQLAENTFSQAASSVQKYATNIVFRESTKQLNNQLENLTPQQQIILKSLICNPFESSASSVKPTP